MTEGLARRAAAACQPKQTQLQWAVLRLPPAGGPHTSYMGRAVSDKLPIVHGLEEKYARNLYDHLRSGLISVRQDTQISVGGAGVHWDCSISAIERSSLVHCFCTSEGSPEYLTSFLLQGEEIATPRTASSPGTIEAILCWLEGSDLAALYQRFAFVDDCRHRLANIRDRVIEFAHCLRDCTELQHWGSGIYYLWFREKTRSARISFYGENMVPDVLCHWDGCSLFTVPADDLLALGPVLKRWLCDAAMPSQMRLEFRFLSIGNLPTTTRQESLSKENSSTAGIESSGSMKCKACCRAIQYCGLSMISVELAMIGLFEPGSLSSH